MADSTETRALLLQINATTELLRSEMTKAEQAVASFQQSTQTHLDGVEERFDVVGKAAEALEGPLEVGKRAFEGFIAAFAAERLLETAESAFELTARLGETSKAIGVSTDFLQKFQFAATQMGSDTATATSALEHFNRSIGEVANGSNKELTAMFDRLKVGVFDSAGAVRSTEAVYYDLANAIAAQDTPSEKAADSQALLGRGVTALVPLLSSGADGFNKLGDAAQSYGVVLSPEMIEHAEQVNRKLQVLKQLTTSEIAEGIVSVGGALFHLAESFSEVATKAEKAIPGLARFINAARLATNPVAFATYTFNAVTGSGGSARDDAAGARDRFNDALAEYRKTKERGVDPQARHQAALRLVSATSQYEAASRAARASERAASDEGTTGSNAPGVTNHDNRQAIAAEEKTIAGLRAQATGKSGAVLKAYDDEIAQHERIVGFLKEGATADMASSLASKEASASKAGESAAAKAARKAVEEEQRRRQEEASFLRDEATAERENAAARAELTNSVQARLAVELDRIDIARKAKDAEIAAEGPKENGGTGRYTTAAEVTRLQGLNDDTASLEKIAARRKAEAQLVDQQFASEQASINAQVTLLQLNDSLATTRQKRLEIEQELLVYQQQLRRDEIAKTIKNAAVDPEAAKNAVIQSQNLPAVEAAERAQLAKQNEGPLAQYRDELTSAVSDMNDALQGVEVNGLQSLEDGLASVVTGTETVGQAFHKMAADIIEQLVKIGIEKAILGSIGGSTGGGGLLGAIFGASAFAGTTSAGTSAVYGGTLGGVYADGGRITQGTGPRSDDVIIRVSRGEFVMNAGAVARYGPLIEAMNTNRLPRFADGGPISLPTVPRITSGEMAAIGSARSAGNVVINANFDARGATMDAVPALRSEFERFKAELPVRAVAAVKDAQDRLVLRQRR